MTQHYLENFTASDWDAFAGAEYIGPGQPPQLCEVGDYTVIVSGNNSSLTTSGDIIIEFDDGFDGRYSRTIKHHRYAQALVDAAYAEVQRAVLKDWFADFGFNLIN